MMNDDNPIGRLYTRREVLALLGVSSGVLFIGSIPFSRWLVSNPTLPCIVRPQQTAGPFFLDAQLHRSDIRDDPVTGEVKSGVPLLLSFVVSRFEGNSCKPLPDAVVDIWHCDALGVYSGFRDSHFDARERKFLRGYQITDSDGKVGFTTIYPGWYPGRAVHIHFKIRTSTGDGRTYDFTSQLYFDDEFTDEVYARNPYSARRGRRLRNQNDWLFRRGGNQLLLEPRKFDDAYSASFDIALHIS